LDSGYSPELYLGISSEPLPGISSELDSGNSPELYLGISPEPESGISS